LSPQVHEATLDKYLQSPRAIAPGTIMTYAGLKDDTKRADLIAYLATLK
jgi:cytochrome c